jgi:hypothetical protein
MIARTEVISGWTECSLVVEALDVRDLGADHGEVTGGQGVASLEQGLLQGADAIAPWVLRIVVDAIIVFAFLTLSGEPGALIFVHGRPKDRAVSELGGSVSGNKKISREVKDR